MTTMTYEDPFLSHVSDGRKLVTTRAGVTIGIRAEPRKAVLTADAEVLQSALLDPITAKPMPLRVRLWRRLARWL